MENMKPLFLIKKAVLTAVLAIFGMSSLCSASIYDASAMANRNTLNVLIRRIPIPTRSNGTELRELSSIQELLVIHEQQMKGAGLPPVMSGAFSINYCAIISALVNDEISEDYGRDLLSLHRQMLKRSYQWASRANRDPQFPEEIVNNLLHFQREMAQQKNRFTKSHRVRELRSSTGFKYGLGNCLPGDAKAADWLSVSGLAFRCHSTSSSILRIFIKKTGVSFRQSVTIYMADFSASLAGRWSS